MSNRKSDIAVVLDQVEAQGFAVELVASGHWKVTAPDGRKCQISATPRYSRGVLNAITRLKRIGFVPPPKRPAKKAKSSE